MCSKQEFRPSAGAELTRLTYKVLFVKYLAHVFLPVGLITTKHAHTLTYSSSLALQNQIKNLNNYRRKLKARKG
jgi:hypothetical protein